MKHSFFFVILLFMGVGFYMMNSYEPLRCDDLIYQYYWFNERTSELIEPVDLSNRIDDIYEAFNSQINHYFVMNGRFVVHFFVSCFCGFGGRHLFSFLNTIVYFLFLLGCVKLLNLDCIIKSTTAIAIIWLGLPIQYILWYSVAFAINYLWVSTAFIYFLILIRIIMQQNLYNSSFKLAGLFLFGLLFGSMHEGFSLPLSVTVLLFVVINRKVINRNLLLLALGLWLGTTLVVLAPGTIRRGAGSLSGLNFGDFLLMKLDVFRYSKRLYICVILLVIFYSINRDRFVHFIKERQLALYFVIIDFCFVLSAPHYSQRIEFPLELLSLLLSLDMFLNSKICDSHKTQLCSFIIILLFIHVPLTVYYAKLTSKEYVKMVDIYLESPDGVTRYEDFSIPRYISSYVHRLDNGVEKDYISFVYRKEMQLGK